MTSNAGSADLKRAVRIGFLPTKGDDGQERDEQHEAMRSKAMEGLKRIFRPEFINRIDQIVVFHSLGRAQLNQIVDLLLAQVRSRLSEHRIELVISNEVRDLLLREGFDEEYGARPLRRTIQTYVDDVLADALLTGAIKPGQVARLKVEGDKIVIEALEAVKTA
jgi:ATP-dependent Clp protease ATP-binding subunit ClpC